MYLYSILIAFTLICVSELGDKTQLLVLSFASKTKARNILLGVALGSFLSHGIAILFGSLLGNIDNLWFQNLLKIITYISFILFGVIELLKNDEEERSNTDKKLSHFNSFYYILVIASSIAIGELGDKTFLASIGLGIQYASFKVPLIIGAILGMIASDAIAIIFGKFINTKFNSRTIRIFSSILFLIFGFLGFFNFLS